MMLLISSLAPIKLPASERASVLSKKKADFGGFRFDLRPVKERSDTGENQLRYEGVVPYSRHVRLIGDSFLIYLAQGVELATEREKDLFRSGVGMEDKVRRPVADVSHTISISFVTSSSPGKISL